MRRILTVALLASFAVPALPQTSMSAPRSARRAAAVPARVVPVAAPAIASRPFCREGRLASGECVNPRVAQLARLTSCVHTQGLLSLSGGLPCATVFQDDELRYPNAVYADTKRALDISLGRRASSLNTYSFGQFERVGPGTPNPPRYPLF